MNRRLISVEEWARLASESRYAVKSLAGLTGMSVRQLERVTRNSFGQSPHAWLRAQRLQRAVELLRDGTSAKDTAGLLGYRTAAHFSHDFKKQYGNPPGRLNVERDKPVLTLAMALFDNKRRVTTTNDAYM